MSDKNKKGLSRAYYIFIISLFTIIIGFPLISCKRPKPKAETEHKSPVSNQKDKSQKTSYFQHVHDPSYVGSKTCQECHTEAYDHWKESHHKKAMEIATEESVLGDFNDATFTHPKNKVKTKFFKRLISQTKKISCYISRFRVCESKRRHNSVGLEVRWFFQPRYKPIQRAQMVNIRIMKSSTPLALTPYNNT